MTYEEFITNILILGFKPAADLTTKWYDKTVNSQISISVCSDEKPQHIYNLYSYELDSGILLHDINTISYEKGLKYIDR